MAALTELEGTVLGLIGREGPCTPYAVRREFASSPTARWRASAGAVYPLLARLEGAGLVRAERLLEDRRGTKMLSLTRKGAERLRAWMQAALPELSAAPADPIRTRVHFLDSIAAGARAALVAGWIAETERAIEKVEADQRQRDRFAWLALAGAAKQLAARRDWLRSVLAEIEG